MNLSAFLDKLPFNNQSFSFNLGKITFAPSYLQAGAVIVLLFLLVLSLASFRRHLLDWSLKGALFGLFFGILFAFIIEGFLLIGGKTAITEILGWKNAPQPLLGIIDAGRNKLVNVLGVSDQIPISSAMENPTYQDAIDVFQRLDPSEARKAKAAICE